MGRNFFGGFTWFYSEPILLFFLCNLFLFIKNKDIASYADDTTPYKTSWGGGGEEGNSAYVIHNLEVLRNTLLNCFNGNRMKADPGKYHLLLSGNVPV